MFYLLLNKFPIIQPIGSFLLQNLMIEHQAVVNTILDLNERFALQPTDKVLSLSNLNFDLSVYDIFGLLLAGGGVVCPDPDRAKDPVHWAQLIAEHRVTVWNTVPMFMLLFVEYLETVNQEVIES